MRYTGIEYFSSVLQCANLLLTDSSKGENALTIRVAGTFSRDFIVRLMTRQNLTIIFYCLIEGSLDTIV